MGPFQISGMATQLPSWWRADPGPAERPLPYVTKLRSVGTYAAGLLMWWKGKGKRVWESARPNPCSTLSTLAGCPTHPSLGNAAAVVHKAARVFLTCPSIPRSPMPHFFCPHFATLPFRCSTMPHASCPWFPTLPFLACPRTPLAHVFCPRSPTLPFLACPGAPQTPISYVSCPRFPTLPLLACPSAACLFSRPPRFCCSVSALFCFSLQ